MDIDLEYHRKLLETKRSELESLVSMAKDSTKTVELDQSCIGRLSRMDAMQRQSMALASEQKRKDELYRIELALKRIESGDYGYCINCDEPISKKRLEFNPAVLTCIDCASMKK
ncbi:MAG: TraR/DksA C4-type zinc finger protein [Alphaproteobacteria bacterium]|nr:TraR/DksA C4-type zinc finger protein [Alphaproteobacteria bacterium]